MKKLFFSLFLLTVTSFSLSACLPTAQQPTQVESVLDGEQKSGTTTLTGTLKTQGKTTILSTGSTNVTLESYELNLSDYNGKTVTVEGKYSGDTLFVSKISE